MPKGSWDKLSEKEKQRIIAKIKQTKLEKYGDENFCNTEKINNTKLERYGDKKYNNKNKIAKSTKKSWDSNKKERTIQTKKTLKEKYGAENYNNRTKCQETTFKKYGVKYSFQIPEVIEKIKQKNIYMFYQKLINSERFKNLITPLFSIEDYAGVDKKYKFQCNKCGTIFSGNLDNGSIPRCFKCYPIDKFTKPHKIICQFLEEKNIPYEVEKYIKPYWVDIFIEPNKIIEVYGDYWHGNPKFYKEGDIIKFNKEKSTIVENRWEEDANRIKYLKNTKNEVLVLWEDDIKNDLKTIKKKIIIFIS
jgi:G:T-mismatch repair DNA endonuclease (very short patch repair protein)/rubrerythrin